MRKFVIITPGRSGSEALIQSLNELGIICNGELFNRTNHSPGSFAHYSQTSAFKRLISFVSNRESISAWRINWILQFMIRKYLKRLTAHGFKISLDQWQAYPSVMRFANQNDYSILYLTRDNKLALTLSLLKARKTGNYDQPDPTKFRFNPKDVQQLYQQIHSLEKRFLNQFIPDLSLTYEMLFHDYSQRVKEVLGSLGEKSAINIKVPTRKVNPIELEDWVENLDEIKTSLHE